MAVATSSAATTSVARRARRVVNRGRRADTPTAREDNMTAVREQYLELPTNSRELRPTYLFMMKCLLYSRMETGLTSNKDFYDEDVNVYIAHLLNSFINPEYVERARTFLSKYDTEVFRRLSELDRRAAEVHALQDQRRLPAGQPRHLRQPGGRSRRRGARRARRAAASPADRGGVRRARADLLPLRLHLQPADPRPERRRERGAGEAQPRLRQVPAHPLAHARRVPEPAALAQPGARSTTSSAW